MRLIPIFKCTNMKVALDFYTGILDFKIKYKEATENDQVVILKNGSVQIMLSTMVGEKPFRTAVNVYVRDVDTLFKKYLSRGLHISGREDSPVHQSDTGKAQPCDRRNTEAGVRGVPCLDSSGGG